MFEESLGFVMQMQADAILKPRAVSSIERETL